VLSRYIRNFLPVRYGKLLKLLWTYLYKATFVRHLVQTSESFDFKKDLTHLPFFCHSRSHSYGMSLRESFKYFHK
jgi:hypothetical protein